MYQGQHAFYRGRHRRYSYVHQSGRPPIALAVDGASLADRTVIANGFPDDLGQAIGEIFVVEQFAGAGSPARGRRGGNLTDQNCQIQDRYREAENQE
jgi:hypothetical protein